MKKYKLIIFFSMFIFQLSSQEVINSFVYSDGYSIIPKSVVKVNHHLVIPYSITKNDEKKAGLVYLNSKNKVDKTILFEGEHDYVINQIISSQQNSNILISAEGYSQTGQESLYFMEVDDGGIVNEFIYNESGNELDPFAILETGNNVLIGGFVKSRELISNSFYNMYSEKQMIYVGEFSKSGEKIWSKGIDLEGYENGICNSMIKLDDSYLLLCHINKIGGSMFPVLVKIDSRGEVMKIVELQNNDIITIGSVIRNFSDDIELYGSYSEDNNHYFYKTIFTQNLEIRSSEEYQVPYRFVINGITDSGELFGGVLIDGGGYNNCIISKSNKEYLLNQFGSMKSDLIFGLNTDFIYSYTIGSSIHHTSTINIMKKDFISEKVNLNKVKSRIKIRPNIKFIYQDKFVKSTINKGVGKVKAVDVSINLN